MPGKLNVPNYCPRCKSEKHDPYLHSPAWKEEYDKATTGLAMESAAIGQLIGEMTASHNLAPSANYNTKSYKEQYEDENYYASVLGYLTLAKYYNARAFNAVSRSHGALRVHKGKDISEALLKAVGYEQEARTNLMTATELAGTFVVKHSVMGRGPDGKLIRKEVSLKAGIGNACCSTRDTLSHLEKASAIKEGIYVVTYDQHHRLIENP